MRGEVLRRRRPHDGAVSGRAGRDLRRVGEAVRSWGAAPSIRLNTMGGRRSTMRRVVPGPARCRCSTGRLSAPPARASPRCRSGRAGLLRIEADAVVLDAQFQGRLVDRSQPHPDRGPPGVAFDVAQCLAYHPQYRLGALIAEAGGARVCLKSPTNPVRFKKRSNISPSAGPRPVSRPQRSAFA